MIANLESYSYSGLSLEFQDELKSKGYEIYSGKVRDMIYGGKFKKDYTYMLHSDRLSAFDRAICLIPLKGVWITKTAKFWFDFMNKLSLRHHLLEMPNDRSLFVKSCKPFRFEFIVRAYLAGSMLRDYQKGQRDFYGYRLEDGLRPYQKLPKLMFTPSTKAEAYVHDVPSSKKEILEQGLCTSSEWEEMEEMAEHFFVESSKFIEDKALLLADTKYEFGKDKEGKICFIDEVHTPDSSRFWELPSSSSVSSENDFFLDEIPKMKDKEQIRQWLIQKGFQGEGEVPEIPNEKKIALSNLYKDLAINLGVDIKFDAKWSEKNLRNTFV